MIITKQPRQTEYPARARIDKQTMKLLAMLHDGP